MDKDRDAVFDWEDQADDWGDTEEWKRFTMGFHHDDPSPGRGGWFRRWKAWFRRG